MVNDHVHPAVFGEKTGVVEIVIKELLTRGKGEWLAGAYAHCHFADIINSAVLHHVVAAIGCSDSNAFFVRAHIVAVIRTAAFWITRNGLANDPSAPEESASAETKYVAEKQHVHSASNTSSDRADFSDGFMLRPP